MAVRSLDASARDGAGLGGAACRGLGLPDEVTATPAVAVERLVVRLGISAIELAGYGSHEQTRTDHLRTVMSYLGWRSAEELSLKELDEFLLARSMEHDSLTLLFRLACEHLITARVVRPGPVKLMEWWLGTGPTEASAAAVKTEVRKPTFLRGLDTHILDLSTLQAERRQHLAAVGRRSSVPALTRRDPHRRYPIVLTLLAQSTIDVLDEVVQLFDQAVSARVSRSGFRLRDGPNSAATPDLRHERALINFVAAEVRRKLEGHVIGEG